MELLYFLLFICSISSVYCGYDDCVNKITLERYQAYLIGFMFLFMFITIVVLIILFYVVRNNKIILGIIANKKPMIVRQESIQGVTICSNQITENDLCRNDASTLTVNTGVDEVRELVETETPTRIEPLPELKPKPLNKTYQPIIQKAQMDALIKDILKNKREDRGSTTLRAIEATLNNLDEIVKENKNEVLYGNLATKEVQKSPRYELKNKLKNKEEIVTIKEEKTAVDGVDKYKPNIKADDEQEVYDMLPKPVKSVDSTLDDDDLTNLHKTIPVYDCPPTKDSDNTECNVVLDSDTDYLLLLSSPDKDDTASYINAKLCN